MMEKLLMKIVMKAVINKGLGMILTTGAKNMKGV